VYIKINLLPQNLRPRKAFIALDYRVILTFLFIIAAAGLLGYYYSIQRKLKIEDSELRNWRQQELMLKKTVDLQNEVIALRDNVSKRINIIKELTGESDIRFAMLQYINKIIPDDLWLSSISEINEGNRIFFSIEGMSYDKRTISTFLASLEAYEKFNSVSLESIRPSALEIRDAYQYSVRVELKTIQPVVEASTQGGPRVRR
jgi:type IV pilus assembly protein PilN